jgi:hypothetical protein
MNRTIRLIICSSLLIVGCATGCGTTKSRTASQQLLLSDAIDQAVASIDFRPLAGKRVYFDTQFVAEIKTVGFVNSKYIISSIRQQMIAANCLVQESKDNAEYIVEARVGTVGTDNNEIVYGLPASNSLSSAASLMPNSPPIPTIPEISFARKNVEQGVAKIAVFVYHRETREPVWQSGITRAKSTSQDFWLFGAGPFQRGTIHDGIRFAGQSLRIPSLRHGERENGRVSYNEKHLFRDDQGETRIADRNGISISEVLENLPSASADQWLTPLRPTYDRAPPAGPADDTLLRR